MWRYVVFLFGCNPDLDEGGCPYAGLDAVGGACSDEGKQCMEFSLCDPCTSDLSACEAIECSGGSWVEMTVSTVCTGVTEE